MGQTTIQEELAKLDQAIAAQENLRGTLTDAQVETTLAPLRQKRAELAAQLPAGSSGAVTLQHSSVAGSLLTGTVSAGGDFVGRDKITQSGDFRGAIVTVGSQLQQVQQSIGAIPHADESAKQELSQLIQQLQEALAQTPADKQEEAEAVVVAAAELVEKAKVAKPNKTSIQISGEGLKKAAQNLASIMPTVLTIAGQIVTAIARFVP
jgi:hypothetical protein